MVSRQFLKFLLVGGLAATVNWTSGLLFRTVMDLQWAVLPAYLVGMATAFTLNRLLVFQPSGRDLHGEAARFVLVNLAALAQVWLVTLGLANFVFPAIGLTWRAADLAHAVGVLSPAITSYLGHRHFTFANAMQPPPTLVAPDRSMPLVVDLDRALFRNSLASEALVAALTVNPLETLRALLARPARDRAARLALIAGLDLRALPVREPLVAHLRAQHDLGRELHLVSAAGAKAVGQVIERLGLPISGCGPTAAGGELGARFPRGFAFACGGGSPAAWDEAQSLVVAGAVESRGARAALFGKPVEAIFADPRPGFRTWAKALRLHQWLKNLLIFVPLLLSRPDDLLGVSLACAAGFVIMGVTASATYLINDLADLNADRRHPTKRFRPVASSELPVAQALVAAPVMLGVALIAATALSATFALALALYVAVTLGYSFRLKRMPLTDVHVLGGLYTLRLVMGTILSATTFSPWLLTFSGLFFTSLSLAKRHAELMSIAESGDRRVAGRGYRPSDAPLTLALGVSLSAASLLVIVQYMVAEAFPSNVYARPAMLWAVPVVVSLWASRIWLLAHRGLLTADPVEFAVRDHRSLVLAAVLALSFLVGRV